MPSWAWLAFFATAGIVLVVVISLRRLWDMRAGAAEMRAETAEATSARVQKQSEILIEQRTVDDATRRLRNHDF